MPHGPGEARLGKKKTYTRQIRLIQETPTPSGGGRPRNQGASGEQLFLVSTGKTHGVRIGKGCGGKGRTCSMPGKGQRS